MQFTNSDGSIVLSVQIDESGLNKGMNSMKNGVSSISKQFKALAGTIATVFSIKAVWDFSKAAGEAQTQTEASVQRLIDIYGKASETIGDFIDFNARAIGMSRSAAASFASVYGNLFSVWADQKTNADLTARYLNMTAVVASKTGRTVTDVQERVRSGLLGNTEAIEDLGVFVNVKTIEITDAFKRIANGRSWEQLGAYEQQQVRTLAILEQATAKYGDQVAETTALTRARYQAAYEDFKATWGVVVNYVLMPVLKVATQIFNVLTKGLQVIAGISGKTVDTSAYKEQEIAIGGAADNQKALTDETKKTAKEQKKLLAGFDDLQIISENVSEASDKANTGSVDVGTIGDISGISGGMDASGMAGEISAALATIMGIAGAALVAIGLLLVFNGAVPWGVGFIIAGAAVFSVSAASLVNANMTQNAANALSTLMGIAGAALLAIGIFLIFMGSPGWGIGFLIAGAATLGVGIFSIVKFGTNDIQQTIMMIEGIAAGALLALGVLLLVFSGANPLSIGLIAAGALLLGITVAQIVAGQASEDVAHLIHTITAIVSAALLVLGIILLFTPVSWGLAFGLIAAGAVGLAAEAALNWDAIVEALRGPLGGIMALAGGFLVALGLVLLLTGVGIPLGIGLLVAGGVSLAAAIAPNWGFLVDKVKETWGRIKDFWNTSISPWFTKEKWLGFAKNIGNGLITGIEKAVNGIITLFEKMINWVINGLNKISFDIPEWLGGGHFGFNLSPVTLGRVSIPRLARGAVIPPNREFLAVLGDQKHGTNIEAPAELIKQMVLEALELRGSVHQNSGSTTVVLEVDGREFGRAVVEQGNRESRRIGTRLVIV